MPASFSAQFFRSLPTMLSGPGLFLSFTPLNRLKVTTDSFCAGAGAAFLYTDSLTCFCNSMLRVTSPLLKLMFLRNDRNCFHWDNQVLTKVNIWGVHVLNTKQNASTATHIFLSQSFLLWVELDTYLFSGCVTVDGTNSLINWLTLFANLVHEKAQAPEAEMLWQTGRLSCSTSIDEVNSGKLLSCWTSAWWHNWHAWWEM